MRAKIRLKIKRCEKTKKNEINKLDIGTLNKKEVKEEFTKELAANVQNATFVEVEDTNGIWNNPKTE